MLDEIKMVILFLFKIGSKCILRILEVLTGFIIGLSIRQFGENREYAVNPRQYCRRKQE